MRAFYCVFLRGAVVTLLVAIAAATADAQTVITNGALTAGTITSGNTNSYTFTATNGNTVLLRAGSATLNPRIVLYNPLGPVMSSVGSGASGARDVAIAVQATNTGTFTVEISSIFGGTGNYFATLAAIPGTYVVSPGDAGGTLTNGWEFTGTNTIGDLDVWTFSANNGDSIVLRMGSPSFNPWIRLYGPDGTLVGSAGSGVAGALNADLALQATNSGTFTVVSSSLSGDGAGNFVLNLAKSPGAVFVAPGDEGGPLTNGWKHTGNLDLGDLDVWTFDASAGDSVILRMGSTNYNPWIRLYGPDGREVGSAGNGIAGALSADLSLRTTNAGTFTVVASSFGGNGTGSYLLNLAKSPGAVFVAPGDDGGVLTNGWKTMALSELGDLDVWTFSANAGDSLVFRAAATNLNPWLRVFGPDGSQVISIGNGVSGNTDVNGSIRASNSGSYTLVAGSFSGTSVGYYLVNMARIPGAFSVAPGDEGGALSEGIGQSGTIDRGDMDLWSFSACKAHSISLICQKLSGTFTPRLRLYGRDGALLGTVQNPTNAVLSYRGTNSGTFLALLDGAGVNDSGTYLLTGFGIFGDQLSLCPPLLDGTNLDLTGFGGNAGATFVLLTATNIGEPLMQWSPVLTNLFDGFGSFDKTNIIKLTEPQRFFRLRSP